MDSARAMLKQTVTPETVRLSHSINNEERKYVTERKTLIKEWLNRQDIDCELEDVPNIALLGSGGGERAAVGMLGSLHQLAQDNLLGSLLYMCGVSGTTWCMSSLYSDPDWSLNKRCDEVIEKLKGPTVDLKKAVDWLRQRKENDLDFNLTDFWGASTSSYFMKEMDTRHLSDDAHRDSTNPYPIYSSIEQDRNKQHCTKEVWFEMTPHESGFSGLGAFIPTSCLRSQFEGGTLREKRKEIDMVLLQGICGSAIADGQMDYAEVVKRIWALFGGHESMVLKENMNMVGRRRKVKVCECVPSRVVKCVSELIMYAEDPDPLKTMEVITTLGQLLEGHVSSKGEMLWNMDSERWKRTSLVERKEFIETVSLELILTSDSWTKDWEDQRCICNGNKGILLLQHQTVFSAKQYADELKLPLPPVKESVREEKDHPQGCYVFEGRRPEEPTIMHMPLFNLQNCQDEEEIKKEWEKYTTFQQPYGVPEIDHVLKKAKDNLKNNRDRILEQILLAVKRRKNRKSVAQ